MTAAVAGAGAAGGVAAVKVELFLDHQGGPVGGGGMEGRGPVFREQSWLAAQSAERVDDLADRISVLLPKGFEAARAQACWTERGMRAMTRLGAPSAVIRVRWVGPELPDEGWEEGDLDLEAALSRAIRGGFKEGEGDEPAYRALGDRLEERYARVNLMADKETALWARVLAQREAFVLGRSARSERVSEGGEKRRGL